MIGTLLYQNWKDNPPERGDIGAEIALTSMLSERKPS